MKEIFAQIIEKIPLVFLKATAGFMAALVLGIFLEKIIAAYVKPKTHSPALVDFLAASLRNIIILIAFFSALSSLGINLQGLMAGFGLTGFAVGFALKDTLANFIAGIFILLYRPFKIGHYIKVATSKTLSDEGFVKKVDLRYTMLENSNEKVLVPNSILFTNSITIFKNPPVE